ncbi:MAG: hypothetical protein R6V05_12810 [Candidatus Brocadiia bacterium]
MNREDVEKLLARVRARRSEAEAEAGHAAEALVRLASGMTPLARVDPDRVRAAADTFADAVHRLRRLEEFSGELRGLLM